MPTIVRSLFVGLTFQVAVGAPCKCLYEGTTLPDFGAQKAGNPLYGTSCGIAWDSQPGVIFYNNKSICPTGSECTLNYCNHMVLEWCYVEPGCDMPAGMVNDVKPSTFLLPTLNVSYSYGICGNPYCWIDYDTNATWGWDAACPFVPQKNSTGHVNNKCDPNTCKCKYEGRTLPDQAANASGNPLYGTSCDIAWDGLPGTTYYKNATNAPYGSACPAGSECTKGCNFMELEWCYVEDGCVGSESFATTLQGMTIPLRYSYDVCKNPACWNDFGHWDPGCPGSSKCDNMMTCGEAKTAYREGGCCGNPSKKVVMQSSR